MPVWTRPAALAAAFLVCASAGAGCSYTSEETRTSAAQPPRSTLLMHEPQREYTYPSGRYELRGDGSTSNPYYWVWVPAGVQAVPNPPPIPPLPASS